MFSADQIAQVSVASAVVQALSAVAIVVLTVWLARLARSSLHAASIQAKVAQDALRESAKQADVAQKALEHAAREAGIAEHALDESRAQTKTALAAVTESRRQRYTAAVPLLALLPKAIGNTAVGTPFMSFAVLNSHGQPAVHARVRVFPESDAMVPETIEVGHSRRIAIVEAATEPIEVVVASMDLKLLPNVHGSPPDPAFRLMSKWFRVALEFRGILGARVSQHYDWHTREGAWTWELREFEILPDPNDPDWREVVRADG